MRWPAHTAQFIIPKNFKAEVVEAVYIGERKVAGYKQPEKLRSLLDTVARYWGRTPINKVTAQSLRDYKLYLIKLPSQYKRPRSISDINHHLRALRLVLNYAKRQRWILRSAFEDINSIISEADETPRRVERKDSQ